jgi:hypothetical protein
VNVSIPFFRTALLVGIVARMKPGAEAMRARQVR